VPIDVWSKPWRIAAACRIGAALLLSVGCNAARPEPPPDAPTSTPSPRALKAPSRDAGDVHGELVAIDGQRVLRVWGTPAQMGHAHGALLREEILELVDGYALDVIPPATLDAAGVLYTTVARIPPRLKEEAEGVIAGMRAAGGAEVPRLGRELRAADLLVLNAMTDLLAIGCSSVSAWGAATEGAAGVGGAPLLVRNLDWSEDPQLLANQVIFVFRPDDPARQPVVSVAFAGYLGCLSCMNEAGVAALFNMGYGDGAASPTQALRGFAPANLLLRDALEQRDVDGDDRATADDLEAVWRREQHAGSYILHVLEPRREGARAPARVLEVEANGVVTRYPDDSELGGQMLAATNHLRAKALGAGGDQPDGPPRTAPPSECSRYARVERTAAAQEHRFDRETLWSLGTKLRLPEAVHTVLVEPEARSIAVWLRAPGQRADAVFPPVTLEWDALIGSHSSD
jgi:hypothetical protein